MQGNKKKNKWIGNVVFIAFVVIILFTPLGTQFKVYLNRLVAMSPTVEKSEDTQKVDFTGWELVDQQGQRVDFSLLKDKVIIINFWATWCPPCIAEKPSFQALYDDYKDKVVFLFVTSDAPEKVNAFQDKHQYSLPVYYALTTAPAVLVSNTLPSSYVIDKQGGIVVEKHRVADWNSSKFRVGLNELLKE